MRPTFDEAKERAEQRGDEWQFGAVQLDHAAVPLDKRMLFTPVGIIQRNNVMDTNGCASRSPVHICMSKFTYWYYSGMHIDLKRWLFENGYVRDGRVVFDETFIEILSGTTQAGNSLKAPLEAIRKYGLIPEMLPLEDGMSWEQYMDNGRITPAMYKLGEEFKKRFTINYEQVPTVDFFSAIAEDYIDVAAHAWPDPVNGVYPATDAPMNHAFATATPLIDVIDSYPPFAKRLATDYKFFEWGYSISVTSFNPYPEDKESLRRQLMQLAVYLLTILFDLCKKSVQACAAVFTTPPVQPVAPVPEPQPLTPAPERETPSQRLYSAAYSFIGKDASPKDAADDDVGCAESLEEVHFKAFGEYISNRTLSTRTLYQALRNHLDFEEVDDPQAGDIAIFPTSGSKTGHCGIVGKNKSADGTPWVMSNNSPTGTWEANYTLLSWREAAKSRGLKNYFFRRT